MISQENETFISVFERVQGKKEIFLTENDYPKEAYKDLLKEHGIELAEQMAALAIRNLAVSLLNSCQEQGLT